LKTLTDGKNQVTTWNYDEYGRATNKVDATSAEIFRYSFDPNGRLTNRWTAAKGNTLYRYDLPREILMGVRKRCPCVASIQYFWVTADAIISWGELGSPGEIKTSLVVVLSTDFPPIAMGL